MQESKILINFGCCFIQGAIQLEKEMSGHKWYLLEALNNMQMVQMVLPARRVLLVAIRYMSIASLQLEIIQLFFLIYAQITHAKLLFIMFDSLAFLYKQLEHI